MNKLQELMTITMEECGELIQAVPNQFDVMTIKTMMI